MILLIGTNSQVKGLAVLFFCFCWFFRGGGLVLVLFLFLVVFLCLGFAAVVVVVIVGFLLNLRRHFWSSYEKNFIIFLKSPRRLRLKWKKSFKQV